MHGRNGNRAFSSSILWLPKGFVSSNEELKVDDFGLSSDELAGWGTITTNIRAAFAATRAVLSPPTPKDVPSDRGVRSLVGVPRHTRERDPQGKSMAERNQQDRLDNAQRHKLKKRRFNEVSVAERQ